MTRPEKLETIEKPEGNKQGNAIDSACSFPLKGKSTQ
jgi:hypothetical protein